MSRNRTPDRILRAAGRRALTYFKDTGDCLFCCVDDNDGMHEKHCTFHPLNPRPSIKELADDVTKVP